MENIMRIGVHVGMLLLAIISSAISTPIKGCSILSVNGEINCSCLSGIVTTNCTINCLHGQSNSIRCVCDYGWRGVLCDQIECFYGVHINDTICACNFGMVGMFCDKCPHYAGFRPPLCTIVRNWPLEKNEVKHLEDASVKNCVHIYHLPCLVVIIFTIVCFCWCRQMKPNKRHGIRCKRGMNRAYIALSQVSESTPPSSFRPISTSLPTYEDIYKRDKRQCDQQTQAIGNGLRMQSSNLRIMYL